MTVIKKDARTTKRRATAKRKPGTRRDATESATARPDAAPQRAPVRRRKSATLTTDVVETLEATAPITRRAKARTKSTKAATRAAKTKAREAKATEKALARSKTSSKTAASKRGRGKTAKKRAPKLDPEDLLTLSSEKLLRYWIDTRRSEWRDAIVERHLPDVVEIARALRARLPRTVDIDDLCNAGYGGLLRCLETFNPKKGRSFQSYLKTRVYGAMVDELRAMDWLPRLMRSRLARRDSIADQLRQDLRREPDDDELAQALGISVDAYRRSYPVLGSNPTAGFVSGSEQDLERLDASIIALGARGRGPDEEAHPLTSMYHRELMGRVEELCNATEWKLVKLHYFQGLKLRDIATKLRLSPARICQIHGRVIQRLKERLREEATSI